MQGFFLYYKYVGNTATYIYNNSEDGVYIMKKLLLGAMLAVTTTFASAGIITIDPTLGDVTGNAAFTQTDTGAQGIKFSDFASAVDNSFFSLSLENAGFAANNQMGLYLYNTVTETAGANRFELFTGAQTAGDYTNLLFDFTEHRITRERGTLFGGVPLPPTVSDTFGGLGDIAVTFNSQFFEDLSTLDLGIFEIGVYLNNGNGTDLFSHNALNLNGHRQVGIYNTFGGSGLAFGWEDLSGGGDNDYNDMVVFGTDISTTAVPEPSSVAIMGLGMLGLVAARRKKAKV